MPPNGPCQTSCFEMMWRLKLHQPHGWHILFEDDTSKPMNNFEYSTVRNVGLELLWSLDYNFGHEIALLRERAGDTQDPYPDLLPNAGEFDRPIKDD